MNENGVVTTLKEMVGKRQRCMFCGDSRAADVEHFWPKSTFPERLFVWQNLLWVCNPCNRQKGTKFPRTLEGEPLLIDPTSRAPWVHLYFVPETGQVVPRVSPATGEEDAWGRATTDPGLLPLNIESVTESRVRAWRALTRAVRQFIASDHGVDALADLVEAIAENERPELVDWALVFDGRTLAPFSLFLDHHPEHARELLGVIGLEVAIEELMAK